jgi:DNA polymerase-1
MSKWKYREEGKRINKTVLQEKSLEQLRESKKFIESLLDLRKSEKLSKTYITGVKNAVEYNNKKKIFVDYRMDGTATGRLSCASYNAKKSMGVSFHTLPRETENNIRSIFVAPKDHAFITVDYSAMELRMLAHIAKEGNMQLAFKSGEDLHTYTATMVFNKEAEKITKLERQIAKSTSFLIVYGGSAFNLAETMGISRKRAEKVVENYQRAYPGIFSFMDHVNDFIRENKYAYTIFGRRRNLPDVDSRDRKVVNRALRQGLNFTIQSSASDILLCSLLGIRNKFGRLGMKSKVVSTVHDSIELISPKEEVKSACEIIYDEMVNYPYAREKFGIDLDVPLAIETEVGYSFGDGVGVQYDESKVMNIQDIQDYFVA